MRKLVVLSCLLFACDDDDPVRHLDGGMIDSPIVMIDAPVGPTPVTLTVSVGGQPQADVKVYFLNPDSSVVSNTTTDVTGVASAEMPLGGSVTAINPYRGATGGISYDLFTFTGVKPADHLKLSESGGGSSTGVMITAPEDTDTATATYTFATPCGSTNISTPGSGATPTTTLYVDPECATTTDFLVMSHDSNSNVLHYFFVANQAVSATLDFTAKTYAAPTAKTYAINDTAIFNDSISLSQRLASTRGELASFAPTLTSVGLPYTYGADLPAFTNAVSMVETQGFAGGLAEHHILEWGPNSASYTLDVDASALADITADPTFDPTTRTISWTEAATGLTPEFGLAYVSAFRSTTTTSWYWRVAGAHTAASLTLPTLPTDVADFNITANDSPTVPLLALGKIPGGYDAVRANIFGNDTDLITTPTGTFSAELYGIGQPQRTLPSLPWRTKHRAAELATSQLVQRATSKPIKTSLTGRRK